MHLRSIAPHRSALRTVGRRFTTAALALVVLAFVGVGTGMALAAAAGSGRASSAPSLDPQLQAAMTAQRAEADRRRSARSTPEAKQRRAASRTRFRGIGAAESLGAARANFSRQVAAEARPVLDVPAGGRAEYLDDRTALIHESGDESQDDGLVTSMLPLRDADGSRGKQPVDYALEATTDGFSPRNPLVSTRLPRRLADGFGVGPVAVTPLVRGAEGTALRWDDTLFYGNVDADTDVLLKAIPGGVELFHQLRSPDAPESLRADLSLPDGVSAREKDGEVHLLRDGEVAGRVSGVVAIDAAGTSVPATLSLEDDRFVIAVPHRDEDFEYPILVDPAVEYYGHWGSNNGDYRGWAWYPTHSAMRQWFSYGLHHVSPYNATWLDGHRAEWYYPAPTGARIYKAVWQFSSNQTPNGNECHYLGMISSSNYWSPGSPGMWCYAHGTTGAWEQCTSSSSCTGGGSDGNRAIWGSVVNGGAWRDWRSYDSTLNNATMYIQDTTAPTIVPNRQSWETREEPAGTVNFQASDKGVGLKKVVITRKEDGVELLRQEWGADTWGCQGTWRSSCPQDNPNTIDLDGSRIPVGHSTITVHAWDWLNNSFYTEWHFTKNRDTTGPSIVPSDDLWNNQSTKSFSYRAPLGITTSDSGSGVKSINVLVNGQIQPGSKSASSCVAGRCGMSHQWWLDFEDLNFGSANRIEIVAEDFKGNARTLPWYVNAAAGNAKGGEATTVQDPGLGTDDYAVPTGLDAQYCDPAGTEGAECTTVPSDVTVTTQSYAMNGTNDGRAPQLAAGGSGWGLADDDPRAFLVPPFRDLDPAIVRKIMPWDSAVTDDGPRKRYCQDGKGNPLSEPITIPQYDYNLTEFKSWMDNLIAVPRPSGQPREVLISFGHTRQDFARCYLPSRKEYRRAIDAFMNHVDGMGEPYRSMIKYYSAWNEPNEQSQPTSNNQNREPYIDPETNWGRARGPVQAGRFYRELWYECHDTGRACVAVGGEFLDGMSFRRRKGQYFWWYLRGLGDPPSDAAASFARYWAFHAYNGPHRGDYSHLNRFISKVQARNASGRAEVWLTENGGLRHEYPGDAERDLKRVLDIPCQAAISTTNRQKITKLLIYQMIPSAQFGTGGNWDSALAADPQWSSTDPPRIVDVQARPDFTWAKQRMKDPATPCPFQ